jgi:hypothetical protein
MKKLLAALLLLNGLLCLGQIKKISAKTITILDCDRGLVFRYAKDTVSLKGEALAGKDTIKIYYAKLVDKKTAAQFETIYDAFAQRERTVFLNNSCMNYGFHYKMYFQQDSVKHKVYIGNYYDEMADSLTRLFEEELKDYQTFFIISLGYGDAPGYIDELKETQAKCKIHVTGKYKEELMNSGCELKE